MSPGVAVGTAYRVNEVLGPAELGYVASDQVPQEIARFEQACRTAAQDLTKLTLKIAAEVGRSEAAIFRSHLQILRDPSLQRKIKHYIQEQRLTAVSALHEVINEYTATFAAMPHEYLKERIADIRDVIGRVTGHLTVAPALQMDGDDPVILVAREILPSQAVSLERIKIAGIVTEMGNGTGHAAILARSRRIPAVSGVSDIVAEIRTGDTIIVDGSQGRVIVRPDPEAEAAYRKLQREFFDLGDYLIQNRDLPAVTTDGVPVVLQANINMVQDAELAQRVGAAGVGLYRTEYLFLNHPDVPDEEEQFEAYRRVIEAAPAQRVTIRTLDLGGDKTTAYLRRPKEANPFMGWRSIRMSFENLPFFQKQLRAILRAARFGRVRLLFPMISTAEELKRVNQIVSRTKEGLRSQAVAFADDVPTGIMIEVPAAALCIEDLLQDTEFVSIGSNDLIQYLMAADRDNPRVAHLCDPLNPAALRLLYTVITACRRRNAPVNLCGEMAGQPRAFLVLLGMGLRHFSMSPALIPTIKEIVRSTSTVHVEELVRRVLGMKTAANIRRYLTTQLRKICPRLEGLD